MLKIRCPTSIVFALSHLCALDGYGDRRNGRAIEKGPATQTWYLYTRRIPAGRMRRFFYRALVSTDLGEKRSWLPQPDRVGVRGPDHWNLAGFVAFLCYDWRNLNRKSGGGFAGLILLPLRRRDRRKHFGHCGGGDVRIIYLRDQRSIGSVGVRRTDGGDIFSFGKSRYSAGFYRCSWTGYAAGGKLSSLLSGLYEVMALPDFCGVAKPHRKLVRHGFPAAGGYFP